MLKAKVVKIEPNRVFLSVKALDMDFWNDVDKKYKSGDIVDGTVNAIKDSGIIVGFDGVLEGFAHISEIFWNTHHVNLSSKFKEGQKVKCVILDIEPERKRIKLGMKQLEEDPFENFIKKYKSGQDVESIVLNKPTDYHTFLFVRLVLDGLDGVEIDGMLHESEMDWNINKSRDMFNSLEVGKKILVRIANINHKSRRVSVSIKTMNPDMFESSLGKVTVGKVYSCEIKNIDYMGLWVKLLKDGSNEAIADCDGFIGKNELSRDKSITWKKFSIGMVIEAKLLKINHDSRCLMLSIKAMENDLHKNAIKNYGNDESTKQSFADILQF
jgi:small subunit ribosomal protein S1